MDFQLNQGNPITFQLEDNETTLQLGGNLKSLSDITDVILDNLQDNQILQYNSSTGEWENKSLSNITTVEWGNITGTISDQTDLQNALDDKEDNLTFSTGLNNSSQTITIVENEINTSGLNNDAGFITDYTVTESDVTQHEEALTISSTNWKNSKIYINESNNTYIHENSNGDIELVKNGQWVQRW